MGISGSLSALRVPEVIFEASKLFNVLLIDILLEPSKVALPDTAPAIAITLDVANFVAVPAFPLTVVCSGWTWSSLAYLVEVPTAAVPDALGAAVAALGKAALVTVTVCPDTVTPDTYCPEVAAAPPVNEGISASVI